MGESRVKVVRVQNEDALSEGPFRDLLDRAFALNEQVHTDDLAVWLAERLNHPNLRVYAALGSEGVSGFVILARYTDPLAPPAWILHFHVERDADPGTRSALVDAIVGWMLEHHVGKIWATNQTGHSDEVHMRLFRSHAAGRRVGGVIEYDITREEK